MARKTIEVARLRDLVNTYNEQSSDLMVQERMAQNVLLEIVLGETGNYHGYQFLGVDYDQDPPFIPDESRRRYL